MFKTSIRASDEIVIPLPAAEVWPMLADFNGYSLWWPKSLKIRTITDGADLLGTEVELCPVGGRPFRCRVEHVEAHKHIKMRYFGGFIDGVGEWRLEPQGQETRVTYALEVEAYGWVVALLGKVLNLAKIHSRHMQSILSNLARILESKNRPSAQAAPPHE